MDIYTHVMEDKKVEAIEKLSNLFKEKEQILFSALSIFCHVPQTPISSGLRCLKKWVISG